MAVYSARQSTYTTGDTVTAAHTNNEFNAILAAFNVSTGHTHDGTTAGDGGPLSTLFSNTISMGTGADTDVAVTFNANSNDGVITWMEDEDYFQFSDDILLSTTEKVQFRDTAIYINSSTDGQLDLVADTEIQIAATTVDINGNVDISGTLSLAGTAITSTAAELNILDGVTSTAAELNILDGVTSTAAELNILDGVTATASELNILDGVTATASELNILDGVTSTAAELNILDGVTSTAAELNLLDGSTAGTVVASKAVVVDSNKDLTGMRNLTIAGDLTISGDDLTMATNTAGHLLIADGTNFNPTAVGDLSEISSVASDDVLLAVDTSGGGLKKITRSTLVAGLATSAGIGNVSEDTTPQLGGDLDVNGNGLVSTSNGNIALTPNGTGVVRIDGNVDIQTGEIVLKNSGSVSNIKFYCESSNAHYTQLQSAAHSDYSGNVTLTLPPTTDTLVGKATTDTLTNKTLTTPIIAEIDSGSTITLDATTDIVLDADGGDIFFKDGGTTFGSATNTSGNLIIKSGTTTALTFDGANVAVAGNLTVNGTTTTVNSTTVTIDDPIFTLGGDTAPGSDDNKDRGIEFRYHTGTAAKVGFFGYDDSASAFTFIADATNSSEVFSGTAGNVAFGNIAGTLTTAAQTNITSVGALDGGSITSGFGAIDIGSSALTAGAGTLASLSVGDGNVTNVGDIALDSISADGTQIDITLTDNNSAALEIKEGSNAYMTFVTTDSSEKIQIDKSLDINATSDFGSNAMTNVNIDSGAIDGATIGANSAAAITGTTITGTTITASTALVPDASGGADLGSTSLEWGDVYIADDKKLYLGSDQNFSIEYDEDGNDTTAVVAAGGVSMAPHGTSAGNGTELRFQELAANGANYVGFKAPDAIASNEVWVLPNADGSADQVLKTDGSNTLSWGDAGGSALTMTVKTGADTITAGQPVAYSMGGTDVRCEPINMIVNDATYGGLSESYEIHDWSANSRTYGPGMQIGVSKASTCLVYDPDTNRMIFVYSNTTAGEMQYQVGTVTSSGTSMSWGTPAKVLGHASDNSGNDDTLGSSPYYTLVYDTHRNKVVMPFSDTNNSEYLSAVVGTVTGGTTNTVSWSSRVALDTTNRYADFFDATFDSNVNKTVVAFCDYNDNEYGKYVHITVSDTGVPSFGTLTTFHSARTEQIAIEHHADSGYNCVFFIDYPNSSYSKIHTAKINSSTGAFETGTSENTFYYSSIGFHNLHYHAPSTSMIAAYTENSSTRVRAKAFSVNSTGGISTGNDLVVDTSTTFSYRSPQLVTDTVTNKIQYAYFQQETSNYNWSRRNLTVSGTTLALDSGTEVQFQNYNTNGYDCRFAYNETEQRNVMVYAGQSGTSTITANHWSMSKIRRDNNTHRYIGIAQNTAAAGEECKITTFGQLATNCTDLLSNGLSSADQSYPRKLWFDGDSTSTTVQFNGTFSINNTNPNNLAGVALNASTILVAFDTTYGIGYDGQTGTYDYLVAQPT